MIYLQCDGNIGLRNDFGIMLPGAVEDTCEAQCSKDCETCLRVWLVSSKFFRQAYLKSQIDPPRRATRTDHPIRKPSECKHDSTPAPQ
jgi:hypothetical protein